MKTLVRIFLALFVLLLVAMVGGYFFVMRPAFQKQLIESRLPAGSSLKSVQVTTRQIELSELKLVLPDGTIAKVGHLSTGFSPWAAVFNNTIQMRALEVEGLLVELPQTVVETPSATLPNQGSGPVKPPASDTVLASSDDEASSPADALYALGNLDWLFDVDSINVEGALIDPARNRYSFDLKSNQMAPGLETSLTASLQLEPKEALQGGLKDFESHLKLSFKQNTDGGFEYLKLESETSGADESGANLLSGSQMLELSIQAFEETAELVLRFNVDLPRPEVFAPELIALQGLEVEGALQASAEGRALTMNTANLDVVSNESPVLAIQLKQRMTLGAQQQLTGELMDIRLIQLPMAWLNPWLGEGWLLSGAPLSAQVALSGESDGALQVKTQAPIELGPLSLSQYEEPLLENVTIRMNPTVRVEADQSIYYDLGQFEFLDRYGKVISGTVTGTKREGGDTSPFAGLATQAKLQIGLAEVLQQPALAGRASVLAGQANVAIDIDGEAEYPAKLQADVVGLRARDLPGTRQDYRLAAQLKQINGDGFALGSNFVAGSENRPSTSIQLAGQVMPETQPMAFKVDLKAPRIRQSDLDLLLAASKPNESAQARSVATPREPSATASGSRQAPPPKASGAPMVERPPWADLNGEVAISIDELSLESGQVIQGLSAQAKITEALLAVSDLKAKMEDGSLTGRGDVRFDANREEAYTLASALEFQNVDPSMFSKKASGSFPVKGLFDGSFKMTGAGATLETALDNSEGDLLITGRNGVLTAFELDDRGHLGLLGAGILGQSLNRPGITALAQAVPYFKDMRFETFALELTREQDQRVRIPQLSFIGDNLRINGTGFIAASSLGDVLNQPLDLTLGLGAKGRLINYLETLQLLGPQTSEDGFRNWNKDIKIGGTLADPNTDQLMDLLNAAARRALKEPESQKAESPATTPGESTTPAEGQMLLPGQGNTSQDAVPAKPKKSKEEKIIDDIEMGLDLLNSAFGQ